MPNTTKLALEASLKKILLHKPLDKITINDLTAGAPFRIRKPTAPGRRDCARFSRRFWRISPLS